MKIRGFVKTTLIDYPGKIAAEVFVPGCNFRCPYCHNKQLVQDTPGQDISEEVVFDFLKKHKDWIEGVMVCGGEPTLQPDLTDFCRKTKQLGLSVAISTNGSQPDVLKKLLDNKLVDFVAMDVKAPLSQYSKATGPGAETDAEKIRQSIELLKSSSVDYEFRTTVVPGLIDKKDVIEIASLLNGAKKYCIQNFRSKNTLDAGLEKVTPFSEQELEEMRDAVKHHVKTCETR